MVTYTQTITSKIELKSDETFESQKKVLEDSFKDFFLISFKLKKGKYYTSHIFKFTHEIELDITNNFKI